MEIKEKAVGGVKWNTVATVYAMVMQLLRLAVLTRLLEKSDFGLVAIATMVIAFTDIFSDLGITVAIIHKQDITQKQYSSLYWLNIIVSVALFVLVCITSPLVSTFYNEPILVYIIPLLGLQILLNGIGKMFQTIKTKNLEFAFLSKVRIASVTIGFIATVIFALLGWGVYSLVVGHLVQVSVNQFTYAIAGRHDQNIDYYISVSEVKDFLKIGGFQLGARIMDFVSSKIDVFLIGRFFGMDDLGIYNLAKELILKPYQIILSLVNNVATSTFAKIQDNIGYVRECYKKLIEITTVISAPIYFCMFAFSDLLVNCLYSPEYIAVSFFVKVLALVGLTTSIDGLAISIQVAYGRTDIGFKWTIVRVALSTIAIFVASLFSIRAVAYGQMIVAIICLFLYWRFAIYAIIKIPLSHYIKSIHKPICVSFVITLLVLLVRSYFTESLLSECLLLMIFCVLYFTYFWIVEKELSHRILRLIKKR